MRRSLLVFAVFFAATLAAAPAHASCALSVKLGAQTYLGSSLPARDGAALPGGVIPGCNDVVATDANGNDISPREPDTPVALHRIPGVPARLAVAYNGTAYLAPGYLPQLASHPLHVAWARRNHVAATACGTTWRVEATVLTTPSAGPIPVRTHGGRHTLLQLDARTAVHGLDHAGYAYLHQGRNVIARVRSCSSVFGGRVLLAGKVVAG